MSRLDGFLLAWGPLAILGIWAFLPGGAPEGSRSAVDPPSGIVAELVGYALEDSAEDLLVLGRGNEADMRLHNAPVARRAAFLLPPHPARESWAAVPARAGLTVRRIAAEPEGDGIEETAFYPWAEAGPRLPFRAPDAEPVVVGCAEPRATITPARLIQLRLHGESSDRLDEPEVLWLEAGRRVSVSPAEVLVDVVSCPDAGIWWTPRAAPDRATPDRATPDRATPDRATPDRATPDRGDPCGGERDGWKRARSCWIGRPAVCVEPFSRAWGARIERGGESSLWTPWGESFDDGGLAVGMNGPALRRIRLELDGSTLDPDCTGDACAIEPLAVCAATSGELLETLGPLSLRPGDLLAVGRTRFLVGSGTGSDRLELVHVRDPDAPSYFRAGAGHDVYHPASGALWSVPACGADSGDQLTLAVRPRGSDQGGELMAADLPLYDAKRRGEIEAATNHHGVPHELPAVGTRSSGRRALVSVCARFGDARSISVDLAVDSPRPIRLTTRSSEGPLAAGATEVPLGTRGRPEEALVEIDGNLIRIAPAAAPRVTRSVRRGLAGYLIFVLVLQAVPLTLARQALRRRTGWSEEAAWPADLGTPTLQQLAGTGIVVLLFIGATFQLFLALDPELAGKPDYLQAFLQGVVVVSTALAAAAGFTSAGAFTPTLPRRAAGAAFATALALLGAAAWWWIDSWSVPGGFWLTALRNEAAASAGAGPSAFGKLLLQAGGASLVLGLVLLVSGVVPWPRLLEGCTRLGLRAPIVGFAVLAGGGLAIGIVQRSALAFELGILAGLAWYAAVYWAFVKSGYVLRDERLRHRAALYSLGSGLLILAFLVLFFLLGADLPDVLSFICVAAGLGITVWAVKIILTERFTSLLRVLLIWAVASAFGAAFASLLLTDMGSVAAWIPAVLAGLFLWLVRPEEQGSRGEDPKKALTHLLLALGLGLVLLGVLDVFKTLVQGLEWQALERPRQRLDLAEDVSYITAGEWITQVRWLASHQDGDFEWVPNVNSDVAVFGLAAGVSTWLAVLASLLVLGVAGCAALAADQALREGRSAAGRSESDRLHPVLFRGLGLLSGMVSVLLIAQWLVHLATGVVLHLPITGLVFPWISHGNTTHLLYAMAVTGPMAAITALGAGRASP